MRAKLPIESSVDHDARLVTFRVSGKLDTKEMLSAVNACFAQRKSGVVYDVLSDHRGIEEPATPDQIKTLIAELMKIGETEGMRAAILVGTDASYGMMRMMSAHAEALGIHVGIFREPGEAMKFLSR